jgi:hypothetical protein
MHKSDFEKIKSKNFKKGANSMMGVVGEGGERTIYSGGRPTMQLLDKDKIPITLNKAFG